MRENLIICLVARTVTHLKESMSVKTRHDHENRGHSSVRRFAHILSVGRYYYNTHGNNADLFKYLLVSEKNHING